MVRTYTARVQQGAVTVHDPSLPENAIVAVTIDAVIEHELSDEAIAAFAAADREFARGEWITGDELIRRLRAGEPVYRPGERQSASVRRPRARVVARKPNSRRAKPRRRPR